MFWVYLYHDCTHAGFWIVNFKVAQIYLGDDMLVDKDMALKLFNTHKTRIYILEDGRLWFIPSFIKFQYGVLTEKNNAHKGVIQKVKEMHVEYLLKEYNPQISPLNGAKVKEENWEIVKEEELDNEKKKLIETMRVIYLNKFKNYPEAKCDDEIALKSIAEKFCGLPLEESDPQLVISLWEKMVNEMPNFWQSKSLTSLARNFQTVILATKNSKNPNGNIAYSHENAIKFLRKTGL